jgi:predicted CXXCH cytochrome family protein
MGIYTIRWSFSQKTLYAIFTITTIAVIGCSDSFIKKEQVLSPTFAVHVPDGPCHVCHRGKGPFQGTEALLAPEKELCFKCHIFVRQKKVVHPAIEQSGCTFCHNPHGSPYQYLLRERPQKLFFRCHEKKDILARTIHEVLSQCMDCHNPHMSDNKFLLKS